MDIHQFKNWEEKALQVKLREPFAAKYNKIITERYQRAVNLILDNFGSPLLPKEYKMLLNTSDTPNEQMSFYEFVESELEILKVDRAEGIISNYNKLINTMKVWKSSLEFYEINLDFIEQFHKYELEQGNLESTVYKKHANFKALITRAVKKKKLQENPYIHFPIKKKIKSQNNDILTEAEISKLHKIYDSKIYKDGTQEVLRTFLFSCYTTLSYAEFHVVTYSDLKKMKVDGVNCLILNNKRTKTKLKYRIPIVSKRVMELLGEGKDFEKIFTPLTNQPTNRYLTRIMEDASINKEIKFHRAIHSARTILALKDVRDKTAERMMGHSEGNNIKDIYTHLSDEDIVREMLGKWVV